MDEPEIKVEPNENVEDVEIKSECAENGLDIKMEECIDVESEEINIKTETHEEHSLKKNLDEKTTEKSSITEEDFKQFRKFVMSGIETLIKENRSISARLKRLEDQITHRNNLNVIIDDSDDEDLMLPICSEEQLHELENSLQDKLFFRKLSLRLRASGGQKLSLVAGAVMGKLMTDELAAQYSWQGRKGKKPINKLQKFTKLVKKTIQLMCPLSTEKEIEEAAGLWLSQANTRLKRAAARN